MPQKTDNPCTSRKSDRHRGTPNAAIERQLLPTGFPAASDDYRFLDWLAGFIDGEGCFGIQRRQHAYYPRLVVKLRDDDGEILHEIATRTGLGRVYDIAAAGSSQAQTSWQVETKSDCARLVALLNAHPLRAKKARDYAIWREAVSAWHEDGPRGDWTRLASLAGRLSSTRAYETTEPDEAPSPTRAQLLLEEQA